MIFQPEYFSYLCAVRVTQTSKAMQTTAIGTVANSLPENEVILLTLLISKRYIPYTDLVKNSVTDKLRPPSHALVRNPCPQMTLPTIRHPWRGPDAPRR